VTPRQHSPRHHDQHAAASATAISAHDDLPHRREVSDRCRAAELSRAGAVPHDAQRAAHGASGSVATRAACRANPVHPGQLCRPNIDIDDGMNDLRRAPRDHRSGARREGGFPRRALSSPFVRPATRRCSPPASPPTTVPTTWPSPRP
jgi:hypothetical protein